LTKVKCFSDKATTTIMFFWADTLDFKDMEEIKDTCLSITERAQYQQWREECGKLKERVKQR